MTDLSASSAVHEMNTVMDRIAEHILQDEAGVSYARFIFLFMIEQYGATTQHRIARALKVSDPAISKSCVEATHDGLIHVRMNPRHKRQRLISLTRTGQNTLHRGLAALNTCFSDLCTQAGIDEETYRQQTVLLLDSLNNKYKELTQ